MKQKKFVKVCGTLGTSVLSSALSCSCQVILQVPVKTDLTRERGGGERARERGRDDRAPQHVPERIGVLLEARAACCCSPARRKASP